MNIPWVVLAWSLSSAQPSVDPASIEVCKKVPGNEVAELFGKELKEVKPFTSKGEFSRCVYLVSEPGSSEPADGYIVWLYSSPDQYDELMPYTEGIVEHPKGLGDEAVLFVDPGDGRAKLRLVVRKRFCLEVTAGDRESAKKLARLALDKFSNR